MTLEHDKSHAYRIKPNSKIDLDLIDPKETGAFDDAQAAHTYLATTIEEINVLQDRLYAEGKRSLLVILQGMDTSGKDGTVRGVFNATGPMGVTVQPFRKPCGEELMHDYLWRAHLAAPRKGTIGIFNRSHYEDVLIAKVRKLAPHNEIENRYEQINAFEKMLVENGTVILKFMLHISKGEQGKRLQERLDHPDKRWKFQPPISMIVETGKTISTLTKLCLSDALPLMHRGMSFLLTINGRATRLLPVSCAKRCVRSIRNIRNPIGSRGILSSTDITK